MNHLIGRKIVGTRFLTQDELDRLDWYGQVQVLILDDTTELLASQDPEGNGPGCLWDINAGELLE